MAEERKLSLKKKAPSGSSAKRTAFAIADQFVPATIVKRLVQGRATDTDKRRLRSFGIQAASNPFAAMATFGTGKDVERGVTQAKRGDYKRASKNLGMAAAAVVPIGGGVGKGASAASKISKVAKGANKVGKARGVKPRGQSKPPTGYPTSSAGMNPGKARPSGKEPKAPRQFKTSEAKRADAAARRKESGKPRSIPKTERGAIAQGTRRWRSALDNKGRIAADQAIAKEFKTSYNPTVGVKDLPSAKLPKPSAKTLRETRKEVDAMGGRVRDFNAFRKRLAEGRANIKDAERYERTPPRGGGAGVRDSFVEALAGRKQLRANRIARDEAQKAKTATTKSKKTATKAAKSAKAKATSTPTKEKAALQDLKKQQEAIIKKARAARAANKGDKPTKAQLDAFAASTKSLTDFMKRSGTAGKTSKSAKPKQAGKSMVLVPGKGRVLKETTGRRANPATGKELVRSTSKATKPAASSFRDAMKSKTTGMSDSQRRLVRRIEASGVGGAALSAVALKKQSQSKSAPARSGEERRESSAAKSGGSTAAPSGKKGGRRGYTVQGGDSLSSIAKKHGVSLDELLAANKGRLTKSSPLFRGTLVRLPNKASDPVAIGVADKKRSEGKKPGRTIRFRKTGKLSAGRSGKPRGRGKLRGN